MCDQDEADKKFAHPNKHEKKTSVSTLQYKPNGTPLPSYPAPVEAEYQIVFQVYSACNIIDHTKFISIQNGNVKSMIGSRAGYKVCLSIGPWSWRTKVAQVHETCCGWNEQVLVKLHFPQQQKQMPRIFVYVEHAGGEVHCYKSWSMQSLLTNNVTTDAEWILLDEEDADLVNSPFLQMQLAMGLASAAPMPSISLLPVTYDSFELRAFVYIGRNIVAADVDNSVDPYIVLKCNGAALRLPAKEKTNNPRWFQVFPMLVNLPTQRYLAPPLIVTLHDHDYSYTGMGSDAVLGSVHVPCSEYAMKTSTTPQQWQFLDENLHVAGEVVASFTLTKLEAEQTTSSNPIPSILPSTIEYTMQILVLGFSAFEGLSGTLHKPFVLFDIGDATNSVQTQPRSTPSPNNPSYCQLLQLACLITEQGEFMLPGHKCLCWQLLIQCTYRHILSKAKHSCARSQISWDAEVVSLLGHGEVS